MIMVMTLIYVLVNALDGLDRGTDFSINMTVIVYKQIGVIKDNLTIVNGMTLGVGIGSTVVRVGILRITIIAIVGFGTELLWIVLAALTIGHASCFWISRTAETMHHTFCDGGIG